MLFKLKVYHTYIALCRLSFLCLFFLFFYFYFFADIGHFLNMQWDAACHGDCVRNIHRKCYCGACFSVLVEHMVQYFYLRNIWCNFVRKMVFIEVLQNDLQIFMVCIGLLFRYVVSWRFSIWALWLIYLILRTKLYFASFGFWLVE
jgi:hypothetical protein